MATAPEMTIEVEIIEIEPIGQWKQFRSIERHPCFEAIEFRDEEGPIIEGYAAVFYQSGKTSTQYAFGPSQLERVKPGAFSRSLLSAREVKCCFNHDPTMVLGSKRAKTLRVWEDERGLRYSVNVPDTQAGRDLLVSIKRGDISGSSFGFEARKPKWEYEGSSHVRYLEDVDLYDVGPVTYPAYAATEVWNRAVTMEEFKRWQETELEMQKTIREKDLEFYQKRLRLMEMSHSL